MPNSNTHLAALLPSLGADLIVRERETPAPKSDELLIRNHATSINPVDWKRQAWGFAISQYPVILGSDVCGVAGKIGSSVSDFKPGDRAFQAYTIVKAASASHLPQQLSFNDGALLPMGAGTSSISLFDVLGLPKPDTELSSLPATTQPLSILVWGGASSLGSMAIQLARLAGFTVFTIARTHHHEYLRSLGAAEVFDYQSDTVVDDLFSAARVLSKPIYYALDAVSEVATLQLVIRVLSKSSKKTADVYKVAHLLPRPDGLEKPEAIEMLQVSGEDIWGRRLDLSSWLFHEFLPNGLQQKLLVLSPRMEVVHGDLNGLQAAMNQLKAGVSGKKLIVELI